MIGRKYTFLTSESFWIINSFFLFCIWLCFTNALKGVCYLYYMMEKDTCVCLHTCVHWRHLSWSVFLGTVCVCSRIWNSLSVPYSHDLFLYCDVTIIAPLFCIAMCVIASIPRLVIICSLSVSGFLCQMKRKEKLDV